MPLSSGMLGTAYDDIRLDAHALQLFDAGLGRLGLQFAGCLQVRNQGDMDQNRVLHGRHVMLKLADGLQERLALDIADRAADLDDGDSASRRCV